MKPLVQASRWKRRFYLAAAVVAAVSLIHWPLHTSWGSTEGEWVVIVWRGAVFTYLGGPPLPDFDGFHVVLVPAAPVWLPEVDTTTSVSKTVIPLWPLVAAMGLLSLLVRLRSR